MNSWGPQKSVKNQLVFGAVFPSSLGPKMVLKKGPKSSPRGSQDVLGATLLLEAVFGAIWGSLWTPRNLENRAPAAAGARFSEILPLAWGPQNRAQNEPKIVPQTTPRGLQIAKNRVPNRCFISKQILSQHLTILGPPNGLKNQTKIGLGALR